MVVLEVFASGTVEAFDQASFAAGLAAAAGVEPEAISLAVTSASIKVVATIRMADEAAATATAATLQAAAADELALGQLLGVTVESVTDPVVDFQLRPSPPPGMPPPGMPPIG